MWRSLSILICHTGSGIVLIDEGGPTEVALGCPSPSSGITPPPELNYDRKELRILVSVYRFNWRR